MSKDVKGNQESSGQGVKSQAREKVHGPTSSRKDTKGKQPKPLSDHAAKDNQDNGGQGTETTHEKDRKKKRRKGGRRRLRLERKYGFFHCRECNNRWQSSHVYCIEGTKKVLFKQECQRCHQASNPYNVEDIICSQCGKTKCECENKRHIDERKQHRADLCLKCKAGWPCMQYNYIELED